MYTTTRACKNHKIPLKIDPTTIQNKEIPKEISSKLRASYYFMSVVHPALLK